MTYPQVNDLDPHEAHLIVLLAPSMSHESLNSYVAIPNWFLWVLSCGLTAVLGAVGLAIPWAGTVGGEISAVKAKLEAAGDIREVERVELNRRLDHMETRFDSRFEKIEQRLLQ